ncbi:MAG: hypothetical protein EOO05_12235 [Chitinophagaceae bacterium]|nr:MAG: hypothetical protein EOO05_12235 [Chitinophagaceae bacterium]
MLEPITVELLVHAPVEHCWKTWHNPEDIKQWNKPSEDWHCPVAENDPTEGGKFFFRMEKKDSSEGFDFKGKYDKVVPNLLLEYTGDDRRQSVIAFIARGNETSISETFQPDSRPSIREQEEFCSQVLQHFKRHAEKSIGK